ncbi:MAG: YitT family protein [Caldilineaceae bacterium]
MKRNHFIQIGKEIRRWVILTLGVMVSAFSFAVFLMPHNIAAGGVSGVGIIVNHFFPNITVAAFYLVMNLPLLLIGFFYLGRWRFLLGTVYSVFLYSVAIEYLPAYVQMYLDRWPITNDLLLSAIYGGLVDGIGGGLTYAVGATVGGTAIIGRLIQVKTGVPLSQVYLFVDGSIVLAAALVFGWEVALYALLTLLLSGLAADYVLEGPSRAYTATIITTKQDALIPVLMQELGRGVTFWPGVGGYTHETRTVILCTIYRPQVNELKQIVHRVDPSAFVVIDSTQQAIGEGFSKLGG